MKLCKLGFHKWQLFWVYPQDDPVIICKFCNKVKFIGKPQVNYWLMERKN